MDPSATIGNRQIALQVGRATIAPADLSEARLRQEVAQFNQSVSLPGMSDQLNAEFLDADKVVAFAAGIAHLDERSLALISGQTVRLNFPALQLHLYSAISAEQLRHGFALEAEPRNDNPKLAAVRLVAPLSVELARTRIASARNLVAQRDARLRAIAATPAAKDSLVLAASLRQQRRSAAMVWLALAEDLARQRPAPADAAALVEAARKALQIDSVAPGSGGMPG